MPRPPSVKSIIRAKQKFEPKTPISEDIFIPNLSGDHSAGCTGTPTADTDIANKKYVDDEIAAIPATTPAGSDREIQFNDGGSFGASSNFYYDSDGKLNIVTAGSGGQVRIKDSVGSGVSAFTGFIGIDKNDIILWSFGDVWGATADISLYNRYAGADILLRTTGGDGKIIFQMEGSLRAAIDRYGNFGIGTISPGGSIEIKKPDPNIVLHNYVHEDTDGGRESRLNFWGQQSGGEITTLARIEASHDGILDDQKGKIVFKTNDGTDVNTPTTALTIDSNQNATFAGAISSATATMTASSDNYDVSGINTLFVNITGNIILGGLTGGVDGQILNIVYKGNYVNTFTVEDTEGVGDQDIYTHTRADEILDGGGFTIVCDGSNWYDCSHAKHV